ncbi:hypothetical protein J3E68DRAFT_429914 [Trichoderma sp. SZMC 28012]
MPPSFTQAAYDGNNKGSKLHATNLNSNHSYSISRFLADQQQYHPVFGRVQSPAEAAAETTAKLLAFEKQFGSSGKPPSNSSKPAQ